MDIDVFIWNSQENRTPMSKTLSGKRVISEASPFDQWREIQFIGSVAPAAVVVGLDPVEYDLANLIPLHGGALEPVDRDNPKFCVTAKSGANREKFIMGDRRVKRLPPC